MTGSIPSYAQTLTDINTATTRELHKEIADNLTEHIPFLRFLKAKGRTTMFEGGRYITRPIAYGDTGGVASYTGSGDLATTQNNTLTAATYPIRQVSSFWSINGLESIQNMGQEAIISLMKHRAFAALTGLSSEINKQLLTNSTPASTDIDGLSVMLPRINNTGTYGGINRATNAWWRHHVIETAVNLIGTRDARKQNTEHFLYNVTSMANQITRNSDEPDVVLLGSQLYSEVSVILHEQIRFVNPTNDATFRTPFRNLMVHGIPTIMVSGLGSSGGQNYIPLQSGATVCYVLNSKYLEFVTVDGRDYTPLEPASRWVYNKDEMYHFYTWAGNLVSSGNKFQGVVDADNI